MTTTDYQPIESSNEWGSWGSRDDDFTNAYHESDQDGISELLEGRKVTKVADDHAVLDNGTVLKLIGHEGGCSCSAGDYDLTELNGIDNIITRAEIVAKPGSDYSDDPDGYEGYYEVFVYAENQRIKLARFEGTDGNGYYGTGFTILARIADTTKESTK